MGILNLTPDSFADSARHSGTASAVTAALRLEAEGADIIDLGGESTRPGAEPVSAEDEIDRVLPVVEALRGRLSVPLSIDTYKASVADAALAAGAVLVNDISGLRYDPSLAAVVAARGAGLVLMHSRGRSRDMYREAVYEVVAGEVVAELREALAVAISAGIAPGQIILDPGLGFAKHPAHSFRVLAGLPELAALGRPVLVGPSRKRFLDDALGPVAPADRDWGTAAAVTTAVLFGAHIVRVHAVKEMVQVVRVADRIRQELRDRD